jgi:hypothetical protein
MSDEPISEVDAPEVIPAPAPTAQRSIWVVVAVSALTSISVWGSAEIIQSKLTPEPPPPTTTDRILDGIEEAWGAASNMDKDDLEAIAGIADLLGGGSGDAMKDLQDAMKIAEMALGALGGLGDMGDLGDLGEIVQGLGGLGDLSQGLGGLGDFGDLDKMMEGAMEQLGGLDLGELNLGDLGGIGELDLGGLLGGGKAPSAPKAEFELSPEADDFGGLDALDKALEDQ